MRKVLAATLVAPLHRGAIEQRAGRAARAVVVHALAHFDEIRLRVEPGVAQRAAVEGERGAEPGTEQVRDFAQLSGVGLAARPG